MFSKNKSVASILCLLLLTSCASSSSQSEIDWKNGAKRAWVMSFYGPNSPSADLPECLSTLPKTELATRHFVKVEYRHVRQMLIEVAELPETLHAKVGEQVELWPEDCSKGNISRISKLLPSSAQ
jgi:hypothetical protein